VDWSSSSDRNRLTGVRESLKARCNVDAVTIDIAALPDDVAEIDADAQQDAAVLGEVFIRIGELPLQPIAALTEFTALANSTNTPSPITFTTRPPCSLTTGSRIVLRRSRNTLSVAVSSDSMSRE
jgi:hypothetical protein